MAPVSHDNRWCSVSGANLKPNTIGRSEEYQERVALVSD